MKKYYTLYIEEEETCTLVKATSAVEALTAFLESPLGAELGGVSFRSSDYLQILEGENFYEVSDNNELVEMDQENPSIPKSEVVNNSQDCAIA